MHNLVATTLILLGLIRLCSTAQGQVYNRIAIHTNTHTSKLHDMEGVTLARANADGTIVWSPTVIKRSQRRVIVSAESFYPDTLTIKRRFQFGGSLWSFLQGAMAGALISDQLRGTGGERLAEYATPGIVGGGLSLMSVLAANKNYIVSPMSRSFQIDLRFRSDFMDEQWRLARDSNTLEAVTAFATAYPEFARMMEVDSVSAMLRAKEVLSELTRESYDLLNRLDEMGRWESRSYNRAKAELKNIAATCAHPSAGEQIMGIRKGLITSKSRIEDHRRAAQPLEGLSADLIEHSEDLLIEWRLACWMKHWWEAPPDTKRKELFKLIQFQPQIAKRIRLQKEVQRRGGKVLLEDWNSQFQTEPKTINEWRDHIDLKRGEIFKELRQLDSLLDAGDGGFCPLAHAAWPEVLSEWQIPVEVKTEMVVITLQSMLTPDTAETDSLLKSWCDLLLPAQNCALNNVLSLVESPFQLAPEGLPLFIRNRDVLITQLPDFYDHLLSCRNLSSVDSHAEWLWVKVTPPVNSLNDACIVFSTGQKMCVQVFGKKETLKQEVWTTLDSIGRVESECASSWQADRDSSFFPSLYPRTPLLHIEHGPNGPSLKSVNALVSELDSLKSHPAWELSLSHGFTQTHENMLERVADCESSLSSLTRNAENMVNFSIRPSAEILARITKELNRYQNRCIPIYKAQKSYYERKREAEEREYEESTRCMEFRHQEWVEDQFEESGVDYLYVTHYDMSDCSWLWIYNIFRGGFHAEVSYHTVVRNGNITLKN